MATLQMFLTKNGCSTKLHCWTCGGPSASRLQSLPGFKDCEGLHPGKKPRDVHKRARNIYQSVLQVKQHECRQGAIPGRRIRRMRSSATWQKGPGTSIGGLLGQPWRSLLVSVRARHARLRPQRTWPAWMGLGMPLWAHHGRPQPPAWHYVWHRWFARTALEVSSEKSQAQAHSFMARRAQSRSIFLLKCDALQESPEGLRKPEDLYPFLHVPVCSGPLPDIV